MRCTICDKEERWQNVCVDCAEPICSTCLENVHGAFAEQMIIAPEERICVDCVCHRWARTYMTELVDEVRTRL